MYENVTSGPSQLIAMPESYERGPTSLHAFRYRSATVTVNNLAKFF